MTIDVRPGTASRGRPRTIGEVTCDRCGRRATRAQARWPEGLICGICYHHALRTRGTCPHCGIDRLLPGRSGHGNHPICVTCAGIPADFHCARCGTEAEHYRKEICARCALRDDLTSLLLDNAADRQSMHQLIEALCTADRAESIHTWLRSAQVRTLLGRLAAGHISLTHAGLDTEPANNRTEPLRSLLVHHGLLPHRDPSLALFERWLDTKLEQITTDDVRRPVEQFARWHHLSRIRDRARSGRPTRGSVLHSKLGITDAIKFLTWLHDTHHRAITTCSQADVDSWLANGPTTRHIIRGFIVWAGKSRLCQDIVVEHYRARTVPLLTQDQRLDWLRELLTGNSTTLPYRIAGILVLLYAQPLVKVAALRTTDVTDSPGELMLTLGKEPAPVPNPFSALLKEHLANRPNLRTGNHRQSPWLFPSYRTGQHLHPTTLSDRLRSHGISLIGARNAALRDLVSDAPPPVVAELLGYSHSATHRHATAAATPYARYTPGQADQ